MGLYLNNNNNLSPIAGTPFEQIEVLKNHIVNEGVKNELPYPYPNVSYTTGKGITWTDNGDGTITAQGVATALNQFYVLWRPSTDPYGDKYKINGVPAGAPSGVTISYRISDKETDSYKRGVDIRAGVDYETIPFDSATEQLVIYLRIASGTNLTTPVTFKPMIWKKDINSDSTFASYAMSNQQLSYWKVKKIEGPQMTANEEKMWTLEDPDTGEHILGSKKVIVTSIGGVSGYFSNNIEVTAGVDGYYYCWSYCHKTTGGVPKPLLKVYYLEP